MAFLFILINFSFFLYIFLLLSLAHSISSNNFVQLLVFFCVFLYTSVVNIFIHFDILFPSNINIYEDR